MKLREGMCYERQKEMSRGPCTYAGEIDAEEVKTSLKLLGLDVSDADVKQLLMK